MAEISVRYGRLTVLREVKSQRRSLLCLCDCGVEKVIRLSTLVSGSTKSCGCLKHEKAVEAGKTLNLNHGELRGRTASPEYKAWQHIKERCFKSSCSEFKNYGARGITICPRWVDLFTNFLDDVGRRPSPQHSIDRIDNTKGYEPGNCRWATPSQQSNNRRSTHILELDGISLTRREWSDRTGVSYDAIVNRLKSGWSVRSALTTPTMTQFRNHSKPEG